MVFVVPVVNVLRLRLAPREIHAVSVKKWYRENLLTAFISFGKKADGEEVPRSRIPVGPQEVMHGSGAVVGLSTDKLFDFLPKVA